MARRSPSDRARHHIRRAARAVDFPRFDRSSSWQGLRPIPLPSPPVRPTAFVARATSFRHPAYRPPPPGPAHSSRTARSTRDVAPAVKGYVEECQRKTLGLCQGALVRRVLTVLGLEHRLPRGDEWGKEPHSLYCWHCSTMAKSQPPIRSAMSGCPHRSSGRSSGRGSGPR